MNVDEQRARNAGRKTQNAANAAGRIADRQASVDARRERNASRRPGFAGVEPGGGFQTPPGGVGVSAPGLQMDGQTPQAFPSRPPPTSAPRIPPMPGQAAPAPGGLPSNLPVPPGGGGGWGPGIAGTPGQTGAPVQASPFATVRPMGVGADPYSTGSTARPVGSGWKNPGQGMAPLPKRPPVTLAGPARTIQSSQGPGGSSTRTQY